MNYRSVRSHACCRIVFAFLAFSCAALSLPANAGVVTNTNDAGPGSLRRAIAAAAPGETITFAAGGTGTIILTSGSLVINKDLNIQGPGAGLLTVIGIYNSVNVFAVRASLVMSGLTILSGKVGIEASGPMTLSNVAIVQNSDGGIRTQSDISVSNCTITANGGSGLSATSSSVTIDRSTISDNRAQEGGGIFLALPSNAIVTNCTIANNSATDPQVARGGGIAILSAAAPSTITNCTIVNNSSVWDSGGIYLLGSTTTVTSCTVANNFSGRYAGGIGGGLVPPGCFFKTPSWLATT